MTTPDSAHSQPKAEEFEKPKVGVRFTHERFKDRADRLDLITHDLHDLHVLLGTSEYPLCDISATGFSYAASVAVPIGSSVLATQKKSSYALKNMVGKRLGFELFLQRDSARRIRIIGRILNFRFFHALSLEVLSKEMTGFLARRGYVEGKDPKGYNKTVTRLVDAASELYEKDQHLVDSQIASTVSAWQFFEQLGAAEHFFEDFWHQFERQPLYVRFGLQIENPEHARQLMILAGQQQGNLTAERVSATPFGNKGEITRESYCAKANQMYRPGVLLANSWKKILALHQLPQDIPYPQAIDSTTKAQLNEELNSLSLAQLLDPSQGANHTVTLDFLAAEILKILTDKGQRCPPVEVVKQKILAVNLKIFEIALHKLGYQP